MADQETTEGQDVNEIVENDVNETAAQDVELTEEPAEAGKETRPEAVAAPRKQSANTSKKKSGTPQKGTKRSIAEREARKKESKKPVKVKGLQSPRWWAPLMVTLMILGLIVVVAAYVMQGDFPVKGLGNGNLFIGFGFMLLGFFMTLGWK